MRVTVLGCGAAGGVPMVSVGWGHCDPRERRNRRRRPSILIQQESGGAEGQGRAVTVLVDTGPDLREQLLDAEVRHLDAVLYTHSHADHCHGIDDLREVNRAMGAAIDAYASAETWADIKPRFSYVFEPLDMAHLPLFRPCLHAHDVEACFTIGPLTVEPLDQDHGYCRTTGYRIGGMAYCTDVLDFPQESLDRLHDLDLWIVGCMTNRPHQTHAHLDKVIDWARYLRPRRTVLTHMSPLLDFETLCRTLPAGIEPAFDGMVLEV